MYENHQPLLTIFKNAIIVVDEFNRIKETEETLTTEVEDFMSNLIESGNGFIGQGFMSMKVLTHY